VAREARGPRLRHEGPSITGSANYIAPEVWLRLGHGKKSDVWSYGVLAYQLLVGELPAPLRAAGSRGVQDQALRRVFPNRFDLRNDARFLVLMKRDPALARFIEHLLEKQVYRRYSVKKALVRARALAAKRGASAPPQPETVHPPKPL